MGHNDKTISQATFQNNMSGMATAAKAAGANPVFVTPISRANGGCSGQLVTAARDIPQTLRELGKSMNIPVIDLTTVFPRHSRKAPLPRSKDVTGTAPALMDGRAARSWACP
jgi:hypothetical protein